jgi:hypothetical protein
MDERRAEMWKRAQALFEDWKGKYEAANELRTEHFSFSWRDEELKFPDLAYTAQALNEVYEAEAEAEKAWIAYIKELFAIRNSFPRSLRIG